MSWKVRDVIPDWRKTEAAGDHQKRFEYVLNSGLWCDVIFVVGTEKRKLGAHKLILRIGSKGFDKLFKDNGDKNSFEVPDLQPEEFNQLLKYLYTGEIQINPENCFPILNVASKYQVFELMERCGKILVQSLTPDTAIKVLQTVIECGEEELEEEALNWISRNANTIIESPSFLELSTGNLKKILARDSLEVQNELQLFEAVLRWGRAECGRQMSPETPKFMRSVLEPVIHLIRFPLVDASDFSLKVATAQVLLPEEIMSVLLFFNVKPELRGTMTTGIFSSKTRTFRKPINLNPLTEPINPIEPLYPVLPSNHNQVPIPIARTSLPVESIPIPKKGRRFALRRLENSTGYLDGLGRTGSMRFKSSETIWLTAIGVKGTILSIYRDSSDSGLTSVQFRFRDNFGRTLRTRDVNLQPMNVLGNSIQRVKLTKFARIVKDEWYTISFQVLTGTFLGSVCDNVTEEVTSPVLWLPDGSERVVKFEFEDERQRNGNVRCFLLEIEFMMD